MFHLFEPHIRHRLPSDVVRQWLVMEHLLYLNQYFTWWSGPIALHGMYESALVFISFWTEELVQSGTVCNHLGHNRYFLLTELEYYQKINILIGCTFDTGNNLREILFWNYLFQCRQNNKRSNILITRCYTHMRLHYQLPMHIGKLY